jgi:beta-lactamase class D
MNLSRLIPLAFLLCCNPFQPLQASENFILLNCPPGAALIEEGPAIDVQISPCSSFKITLCLMGFDASILSDGNEPTWPFQEGYDSDLERWKAPHTPQLWLKNSCVWFSKVLAEQLGPKQMQAYVSAFLYGNGDASGLLPDGGNDPTYWIHSSLKISPREQALFLQTMLKRELPISDNALAITRELLFIEELADGWKLFGKTGYSGRSAPPRIPYEFGWFVGWIERDEKVLPFAYLICQDNIALGERIPRTKQLLIERGIIPSLPL